MEKLADLTANDFVKQLASKAPTPGGGGAAALAGALGAALGSMVASLTVGKKKYADVEDEIISLNEEMERIQKDLMILIDKDAELFAPLAAAYGAPSETDEQKDAKEVLLQKCFKDAAAAPVQMMEKCGEAIDILVEFAAKGSTLAISDAACGAVLCSAAMRAAWLNVCVNTKFIKDEAYASALNDKCQALLSKYLPIADNIFDEVERKML